MTRQTFDTRSGLGGRAVGATAFALAMLATAAAQAQSRWIFVNGERMNDAQVFALARMNCSDIPNGSYWIAPRSGAWGYAGNPVTQGVIGQGCSGGQDAGGVNQDGTRGPFATMRRAEEEADKFRGRGLRAWSFHNGDGYYIRISR